MESTKDIKLLIAATSCRDWKPQFGVSFTQMICQTFSGPLGKRLADLSVAPAVSQSLLPASRQRLLNRGFDGGFNKLMLVDDDMAFPANTAERLLAHNVDMVCANVCQKTPDAINGVCLDNDGNRINSAGKSGLERVLYGTLALAMIDLDAIRSIPAPHFEVLWSPTIKEYVGEDHYFFKKLGYAGVKFHCDHDLTREVQHIGDYPYCFEKK
jgi:hypothetical protein